MQCHNPAREIEILATFETLLNHERFKRILVGMPADRFGEIPITIAVAEYHLAEPR